MKNSDFSIAYILDDEMESMDDALDNSFADLEVCRSVRDFLNLTSSPKKRRHIVLSQMFSSGITETGMLVFLGHGLPSELIPSLISIEDEPGNDEKDGETEHISFYITPIILGPNEEAIH